MSLAKTVRKKPRGASSCERRVRAASAAGRFAVALCLRMGERKTVALHLEDGAMPTRCFAFEWGNGSQPATHGRKHGQKAEVAIVANNAKK